MTSPQRRFQMEEALKAQQSTRRMRAATYPSVSIISDPHAIGNSTRICEGRCVFCRATLHILERNSHTGVCVLTSEMEMGQPAHIVKGSSGSALSTTSTHTQNTTTILTAEGLAREKDINS